MKEKHNSRIDLLVTVLVCLLAGYHFYNYVSTARAWEAEPGFLLGIICLAVLQALIVHLIKALRLYLILFENRKGFSSFIVMYAETSLVNLLLPYKSGELYRGFRVGRSVSSLIQGYVTVLFDRFIDTLALVTTILLVLFYYSAPVMPVFIIFFTFCLLLILVYCLFPPLYKYLNHFLVFNRSSENTLIALRALQLCKKAYENINKMARGRFLFLYLLSVLAWLVEVGNLMIVGGAVSGTGVGEYLRAAILGSPSQENVAYFHVCFALFGIVSIFVRLRTHMRGEKDECARSI